MKHVRTGVACTWALFIAACGGGGGGGDSGPVAAAPAPAGTAPATVSPPSASGPSAPAPTPAPTPAPPAAFSAFGPEAIVQVPTTTSPDTPPPHTTSVARLADGSSVVAWRARGALGAQRIAADGTLQGSVMLIPTTRPGSFSVVALTGGDWVVAWAEQTEMPTTQMSTPFTVRFQRYSATGELKQDTTLVTPMNFVFANQLQAVATPDGGFAVTWVGQLLLVAPVSSYLQRFDASGVPQGPQSTVANEDQPRLGALADGSVVLATRHYYPEAQSTVVIRHVDALGVPVSPPATVEATRVDSTNLVFDVAALPDGHVGLGWSSALAGQARVTVNAVVLDAAGMPLTQPSSTNAAPSIDDLTVAARPTGFALYVQRLQGFNRGSFEELRRVPVAADGTLGTTELVLSSSLSSVSPTTGATTGPAAFGFAVAAGTDDHLVTAFEGGISGAAQIEAAAR